MTLADKVTSIRLIFAPIFFAVYFLPRFFPSIFAIPPAPSGWYLNFTGAAWTVPILIILFTGAQLTDLFDGKIARKQKEVSDFGKLYDPFADTLAQVTFFLCFVIEGILPPLLFLVMLYREFSILFLRNLMLKKGVAMQARMGGKAKTVTYIVAGSLSLLAASFYRVGVGGEIYRWCIIAAVTVFAIAVVIAVISFFDYVSVYRRTSAGGSPNI